MTGEKIDTLKIIYFKETIDIFTNVTMVMENMSERDFYQAEFFYDCKTSGADVVRRRAKIFGYGIKVYKEYEYVE